MFHHLHGHVYVLQTLSSFTRELKKNAVREYELVLFYGGSKRTFRIYRARGAIFKVRAPFQLRGGG